jgi:hypothetical protein
MRQPLLGKIQLCTLACISIIFLISAPSVWHFHPDSGIYIGTAESMIETGQYRFSGQPNLLYYPGFSSLLSLIILSFGMNFHAMYLFCAAMVVAALWLARAYFPSERYGLIGMAAPILLACTQILQFQIFYILSDGTFLVVTLAALLLWRLFAEKSSSLALVGCFILVTFAPMLRFQGLFLCGAFTVGLFIAGVRKKEHLPLGIVKAVVFGLATLIPFSAWTYRNFVQFTPDTFNMAHCFFFGQAGLELYSENFGRVEWISAEWKYGIYHLAYSVRALARVVFGESVLKGIPTEVVVLFAGVFVALGSLRWLKKSNYMERLYVIVSLAYIVWSSLSTRWLYVQYRYWLPMLPFILILGGLGLRVLYEQVKDRRFMLPFSAFIVTLFLLIFVNGLNEFISFKRHFNQDYYRNANRIVAQVKEFMDEKTRDQVPVATTNWSVMPFVLKRTCYPILNDKSHMLSLERMNKYGTKYLVILDELTAFAKDARNMVEEFPELFTLLVEIKPQDIGPSAAVYEVDLEGLESLLENKRKTSKDTS